MAEDFQRNRQYQYALNSNLVLEADRKAPRRDEGKGEVESLKGKLGDVRMGDRVNREEERSELSDRMEKARLKRQREDEDSWDKKRKGGAESNSRPSELDLDSQGYRPKTRESKSAYEEILSFVQFALGDQPRDILHGAADEVLSTLKDEGLRDPQREKLISSIFGAAISTDKFSKLVSLGKQITDFGTGEAPDAEIAENRIKVLDEDMGVAVVFDGDDDDDDDDDFDGGGEEQAEEEEEEEEEEDGKGNNYSALHPGSLLRGEQIDIPEIDDASSQNRLSVHGIDAHWLQRQLSKYYSDANASARLAESVLAALQVSDERVCENKLVVLLDYDKFDLVKLLLLNRAKIYYCTLLKQAQSDSAREAIEKEMALDVQNCGPLLLEQLKEKASAESWSKDRMGEFREKARREARALINVGQTLPENAMDTDDLIGGVAAAAAVVTSANLTWEIGQSSSLANVPQKILDLEGLQFSQGSHLMMNRSCELPEKTRRIPKKGYEEVHVPAIRPVISSSERLIEIVDLPKWAQPAFPGLSTLNRIQSRMVDAALYASENILLCAPTGAGKTNVALLCMLNQIGQHLREDGTFNLEAFKIVYIAPMKALVQECVQSFGKKLAPFGITVRELSGDQNLTSQQIQETQVIITTPEKWDIITRKAGDRTYTQLVRLMIIDEIHLLHDERGPVLESIVARTIRQIEATQEMVRLVGLSATLPNFEDVATFLRVSPEKGLFFFDNSFRPVPLQQQYIGITEKKALKRFQLMNEICYEKVLQQAGKNQVLIFTHSRADTVKTAKALRDLAVENDTTSQFVKDDSASREILGEESETAKNLDLKDLLKFGFAIHHAGMVRSDRTLVEDLFSDKHVQVLVSTATLAWGVNLPCHTVIIKGTQMYNPELGRWTELSPLDIMQMLGRAGRYGLDSEGEGIIMTQHSELQFYLSLMNQQLPIESQFIKKLPDMLNAEIVLGTVMSVREAASWLGYTYLFVRMLRNPIAYGVSQSEVEKDATLFQRRLDLCHTAASVLDKHNLIKYDRKSGLFQATALGRVASHYYVSHESINVFNEYLKPSMSDIEIFNLFSLSGEFKNIHVRDEEKLELSKLVLRVPIPIKESVEESSAKINVLLQSYISRLKLDGFALAADMTYVQQSACRLMRALFEVALKRGWSALASRTLNICKMVERRTWCSQSPLRQFSIPEVIIKKLEKVSDITWERYYDLKPQDLGEMVKIPKMGKTLHKYVHMFPKLELSASVLPITRSLLRVFLTVTPDFQFDVSVHDNALLFWVIAHDVDGDKILHCEPLIIQKQHAAQEHYLNFSVPILDPLQPQYFIKVVSDRWLHSESVLPISFRNLILPQKYPPLTELLDLQPLPVASLVEGYRKLFRYFKFFNPIQTQCFGSLFESDQNVLICAPTGSGKTVCAELAMLRLFSTNPTGKCVYVVPKTEIVESVYLKWSTTLTEVLDVQVVKLTGETITDLKLLESGNIIMSTAVNWDMLSRRWKQRKNVQSIDLYIADELHLIATTDGPTLEIVLSRARYVSAQLERPVRIVGLSSSLANAKDVGEWCGVVSQNIFNFPTSVRPVPLEINLQGFDANHVFSRILSMSKHAFNGLTNLQENKSALVFVPSRKQAQLSAIDFITFAAGGGAVDRFLNVKPEILQPVLESIKDASLAHTLAHGVGFYHLGLASSDQKRVCSLFRDNVISVLVMPFDLCWQAPAPASMVIVLDTVYYEGREHRYVDYPLIDLIQMVGLSSRPAFDNSGKAIILCHSSKKEYLKRLVNEPLPVESHLGHFLHDHMNAEIVTKTVENKQDAVDLLTWTFYYRRLVQNPNYYNLQGSTHRHISEHLSEIVESTITDLEESKCVSVDEEMDGLSPLNLGMIASYYYIQYTTVELFASSIAQKSKIKGVMEIVSASSEFAFLPMRHSEDEQLRKMAFHLPQALPETARFEESGTKALILLQTHFSRRPLPTDLNMDLKTVLRDSMKLLQALVDVISSQGWLRPALAAMELSQMVVQGLWDKDSELLQIPHFTSEIVTRLKDAQPPVQTIFDVLEMDDSIRDELLQLTTEQMSDVAMFCNSFPNIDVAYEIDDSAGVVAGDTVTVNVTLQREVDDDDDVGEIGRVICPRYPFPKTEGWWLVVGDTSSNALLSIKRITVARAAKIKLEFAAPEDPGDYTLTLYLMCDSYFGTDQEYKLSLTVLDSMEEESG